MSRVYFNSLSETAELRGYEFYWLGHLATGPARAAWDLDGDAFDRACAVVELAPEVPDNGYGSNFLHVFWREAVEQDRRNKEIYKTWKPGTPLGGSGASHELIRRFIEALKSRLDVGGLDLNLFGVRLNTADIGLNTALLAGSDQVALAAKVYGWCDKHPWVEGPDRAWLADIMEQGLETRLFRRGAGWEQPVDGHDEGPGVIPMLRARDDEPVVLSHSTYEGFPNPSLGDWMPPWPDGVERNWDALTEAQQQERQDREEEWYELPSVRQWEIALAGLRAARPWARLSPDTLRTETFREPVTVYDVTASDRDERLRAVLSGHPDYREPATAGVN